MLIYAGYVAKLPQAATEEADLETDRSPIADRLLVERARARLSIQELAERSGTNAHTISDIERGLRKPRATTLAKLAGALGLEPEELLGKAPAPSTSGLRNNGGDESPVEEPVKWGVLIHHMYGAGDIAREVVQDWWEECARASEEAMPLPKYRMLEMKSLHNELSRQYVGCFKNLLEAASLSTIGIYDNDGVGHYLAPEPSRWPQQLRENLHQAGAWIAALPEHIDRIERELSEQQRGAAKPALYEVETNHEAFNKVLAAVGG